LSVSQELWDTFRKLAALEARTEDVMRSLERVGDKLDSLIERVSRVEIQYQNLRENVRNEILSDLKAEIAVLKFAYGHSSEVRSPLPGLPSLRSGDEGTP
jgi:regulator of replication initiation timing